MMCAVLLALLVTLGCAGSGRQTESPMGSTGYELRFGEGGGITGLWTGYTVEADGRLTRWEGRSAGANPEAVGTVDAASRAAFWSAVTEGGILDADRDESGNLTRMITVVESGEDPHTVKWALGASETPLDRVYGELLSRAEHLASK